MRYDTPIFFQKVTQGKYDPNTGDYEESTTEETCVMASVMDTRTEIMRIVYGTIQQGSLTVHILNHYNDKFDSIRIGDRIYNLDYKRSLRNKQTFILHEAQNGKKHTN